MKTYFVSLSGEEVTVNVPEHPEDLTGFDNFLRRNDSHKLGYDTETTGLQIYTPEHRLRLVQFGDRNEAWVLRADRFDRTAAAVLSSGRPLVAHNSPYDCLVADRHLGVRLEILMPNVIDTRTRAHLLDPRTKVEGGLGLKLKDLSSVYVDPAAPDTDGDLTAVFRSLGLTKATGFARIDIEHPTYNTYAGLDTILARRLDDELAPMVEGTGQAHLFAFESHLALLIAMMQRKGMRLDVGYTQRLLSRLRDEAQEWRHAAAVHGLENVSSPRQVAKLLIDMGETLTERTDTGAYKVDRAVLSTLADLDRQWERIGAREPNPVAEAVMRAKRADKWATTYAQALLDLRDEFDRVHPSIGALQARTARMSISNPPLQQLPSGDWTVRRAFLADPGMVIIAADYQAVEMRVLAALANEPSMKRAIASGEDLHAFTAALVEGVPVAEFVARLEAGDKAAAYARKLYKGVGFGKVYGGGAATLSRQTGAPVDQVRAAIAGYDRALPGIKRYSQRLQRAAQFGAREVVTPAGRHLPLDRDRLYAATNYIVQSTARDLLAQAIVDIHEAGLGDHLLLPVHDELIAQAPADSAEEVIREIGRIMESDFKGVRIAADPEVYGASWGHGYGATE